MWTDDAIVSAMIGWFWSGSGPLNGALIRRSRPRSDTGGPPVARPVVELRPMCRA